MAKRQFWQAFIILLILVGWLGAVVTKAPVASASRLDPAIERSNQLQVTVSDPVSPQLTIAVSDLPAKAIEYGSGEEINPRRTYNRSPASSAQVIDGSASQPPGQQARASGATGILEFPTPILNINGQGYTGVNPPDTVGDVGPSHYIQMINSGGGAVFTIYNKSGDVVSGPTALEALAPSGACMSGSGDPIVLYDSLADRWMLSEFATTGNHLCVYISTTPNPTGAYYMYDFITPEFPDYPKYAVWPDAYYVSSNESSPAVYALDRQKMLAGLAATSQRFTAPDLSGFPFQALTPGDFDGATPPPAGSPNYFMRHRDTEAHGPGGLPTQDILEIWSFHVDFATPANSTFTGPSNIFVSEFDSTLCGLVSFSCIPQPGTSTQLDPLREVIMWRLQYRNFGAYETLVGNLVTDVDGANHAGVRWFELRKVGAGAWTLYQEGTVAPDAHHRWMGAIAMDGSGNIALGYNVSSSSVFPSLRYIGRLRDDPPGTMPQGEFNLVAGTAANVSNRYGDYSAMSVDPVDNCTFWFTGEYNAASTWSTRIGAFKFDSCSGTIGPYIAVAPTSLSSTQLQNSLITHTLTISNIGTTDLHWYVNLPARLAEQFDDITVLPGNGWALTNMSDPLGITGWFQGNNAVFPAQAGAPSAYIGANFNNTAGVGSISNWLLTPELPLRSNSRLSFWTRTTPGSVWPDRLEVRMSNNGGSTNVGPGATGVGDFSSLLYVVNPNLVVGGYPEGWERFDIPLGAIGNQSGRLALRYFVTNAGPSGANANYIGVDSLQYALDIPWLNVVPISGTTGSGLASIVEVGFDSNGLVPGVYTSTLLIQSDDVGKPTVSVPVTMTVAPSVDLVLTKSDSPDPVYAGDTLTYTLSVTNNGPSNATGVTLIDLLPLGVTYQSATSSQCTYDPSTGPLTCDLGVLLIGETASVEISVEAPVSGGAITNQASVSANQADLNAGNNAASALTTVLALADLALSKADSPDPVLVGESLTYTLEVTNGGPSLATGVMLTDTLPVGGVYQLATSSQGTCTHAAGRLTCALGALGDGASASVTLVISAPATPGTITNHASISANETDPNLVDNTAVQDTLVKRNALFLPMVIK